MSYLYVKWNSGVCVFARPACVIRACSALCRPLLEQRPATPEASRFGRSAGSGRYREGSAVLCRMERRPFNTAMRRYSPAFLARHVNLARFFRRASSHRC
jgi:hypothetical protein